MLTEYLNSDNKMNDSFRSSHLSYQAYNLSNYQSQNEFQSDKVRKIIEKIDRQISNNQ